MREVKVTFHCDCPCANAGYQAEKLACFFECETSYHDWTPDGVNDSPEGWYRDIEEERIWEDDYDTLDYCEPCWKRIQSEAITPHKKGE